MELSRNNLTPYTESLSNNSLIRAPEKTMLTTKYQAIKEHNIFDRINHIK